MAQKSIFWTTGSGGDGAAAYTQAEIIRWQRQQWMRSPASEGVHPNFSLNEDLRVTTPGSASPFNVATGAGMVYGFPYWNTTNYTAAIPTPVTGTRYDRIVLQADWSSTAVRIARLGGVAGGTQASLTQTDGVKWEVPLARITCTTNGTFTVTDKRRFIRPNILVDFTSFTSGQGPSVIGFQNAGSGSYENIRAATDERVLARSSNKVDFYQINANMMGAGAPAIPLHRGGSASTWYTAGSNNYTSGSVLMLAGCTAYAGTSARSVTGAITVQFPQRFDGAPLVFWGVRGGADPYGVVLNTGNATAGGVRCDFFTTETGPKTGFNVHWLAIGQG